MLSDLRLEVKHGMFGAFPTTIPGVILQSILMALPGRLFVQMEGKHPHMFNDMFRQVAITREVNSAFYLSVVDCWPTLQEEFVRSMAAFIKIKPEKRMPFDCVADIMKMIDPSLSRHRDEINHEAAAKALCFTFHEKLKRHLRYHCATQLMMLLSNDSTINEKNIVATKGALENTIPTLSGFADYLDTSFGLIISQSVRNDSRNETICLFYESEWAPAWNMLPDIQGTKNLQAYLDGITIPVEAEELICAPTDLFKDKWPELSEIGSLDTYIFNGGEKVMPPIRKVVVPVWDKARGWAGTVELVAEIILPMRLLLTPINETDQTTWQPAFDFYTMNITTDMLTQSIWEGEMPVDFDVYDHKGVSINAQSALEPGSPLPRHLFAVWADVMLTYSAQNGQFSRDMENLPLFRNFVLVRNGIKAIFPNLGRNIYIDGNSPNIPEYDPLRGDDPQYDKSPIQKDWGRTSWVKVGQNDWELSLDPNFLEQEQPHRGESWTTAFYLDMSQGFLQQDRGFKMDPTTIFTPSNIRGNIWGTLLKAEDITPLMRNMNLLWSRHKFPTAEVVVARQHTILTRAHLPAVPQDPRHRPSARKEMRMTTINSMGIERRRARFQ